MAAVPTKVVVIVTVPSCRQRVGDTLDALGVRGFSVSRVEGRGVHGDRISGFFDEENLSFTVVTSAAIAPQILHWVEGTLAREEPSIAYSFDAMAVPPGHFT
jgi:hypothetical protein